MITTIGHSERKDLSITSIRPLHVRVKINSSRRASKNYSYRRRGSDRTLLKAYNVQKTANMSILVYELYGVCSEALLKQCLLCMLSPVSRRPKGIRGYGN